MPELKFPTIQVNIPGTRQSTVPKEERQLKIEFIEGKDFGALAFNILSLLLVFVVVYAPLKYKGCGNFILYSLPLIAVWVALVFGAKKMWVEIPEQQAKIFVDIFHSKTILVYTQGGNFVRWSSRPQTQEVDFQKFTEIKATRANENSAVGFASLDGFDVLADLNVFFRYREGREALQKSLRYRPEELKAQILALISSELSGVGGCNEYSAMLENQATLGKFVANLFGGERNLSEFEQATGIDIMDPKLKSIGLTPESQKIFEERARANTLVYAMKNMLEMKGPGGKSLSAVEAGRIAQTVTGNATRIIHTYEGVPPGATTVALGDTAGIALSGDEKGKKGGK